MIATRAIKPVTAPLQAVVTLPGSKSITNRALVCAGLAEGSSTIRGALLSDDTAAMISGLRALGVRIEVTTDATGPEVLVDGVGGRFPAAAAAIDARLSGTTSRFLLAAALCASGPVTIDGRAPLRRRPMADAVAPLEALGARVRSDNRSLPMRLDPPRPSGDRSERSVGVSGASSSQFLSGLLMVAPCLGHDVEFVVDGVMRSRPYVDMTLAVMAMFGRDATVRDETGSLVIRVGPGTYAGADVVVEPDASAASYFWAVAAVTGGTVTVTGMPRHSLQGDIAFLDVLESMGARVISASTASP